MLSKLPHPFSFIPLMTTLFGYLSNLYNSFLLLHCMNRTSAGGGILIHRCIRTGEVSDLGSLNSPFQEIKIP